MKRPGTSFGSCEPQETYPLPMSPFITLITHLLSFTLALPCPGLPELAHPSLHLTAPYC